METASSKTAHQFVKFALSEQVLRFGQFKLKSGRTSPYFFNAGLFHTGGALSRLGEFYADAIVASGIEFDSLFGPAYKGIPLAASIAIALYKNHGRSVPYAYNRKEVKDHGEGGIIVGQLQSRVLLVDDVITAGTAIRESVDLIHAQTGCRVVGVVVAMDREERFKEGCNISAIQQVQVDFGFPILSVARMTHIITYLENCFDGPERDETLKEINKYRVEFGVASTAGA